MQNENQKPGILKIVFITLLVLALLVDVVYAYLAFFGKEKNVVYTLEGGTLKNVDDINKKYIFNIRYFKNKDKTGKECFELKLNYFTDEETGEVYSTGIQMLEPEVLNIEKCYINSSFFALPRYFTVRERESLLQPYYLYNMYDNDSYVLDSYVPTEYNQREAEEKSLSLFSKKFFTISIGDDIYQMKFKNDKTIIDKKAGILNSTTARIIEHNNFASFVSKMYETVKTAKNGESQTILFEFWDNFSFSKYDAEKKQYVSLEDKNADLTLIQKHVKEYFAIKFDIYDNGITKSTESLFNCVFGNFIYNTSNTSNTSEYFTGNNIILLNEYDFEYKFDETEAIHYLVLKNSVKNYYSKYSNIKYEVKINLTYLQQFGLQNLMYQKDKSNFDNLDIYRIEFYTTDNDGNILTTEVIANE